MRPTSAHKNCTFCYLFSFQYFVWFCIYPSTALQIRLEIAGNKTHFSWLDSAIPPCNFPQEEQDLSVPPSSMKKKKYRQRKIDIFGLYCSFSALFCHQLSTRQPTLFLSVYLHRIFRVRRMDVQAMTFLTPSRPEELSVFFCLVLFCFSPPLLHVYWFTLIVVKMSKILSNINTKLFVRKWRVEDSLAEHSFYNSKMQTLATAK